ncbi:Nif3-like dinuclear metal center hexameric protein [Candidatus Purcelliella pentastirinorum]|uniref:Nif3-like dinuclear metal center hexameric protein n=1 Tax=Candidatus Purcelliella pentastirinorum TaxID=472834 RepID=UPI00236846E6|nr:Nif3-like dinuclear metal center hexameric protein [Candidatus Purcelliella pentastirinorum]WDI79038.1 Nif3-like dinuclear metal center hexameric protein [Candidatus Purcelliella pentastirinorum]WDR80175.1 Nif3-like dinuclear metal center hexameric protein [Candidatus Purcelliella pentastirinorum]
MDNIKLENIINKELNVNKINDYLPNGLQIEGCKEIKIVVIGVSLCQELLDKAVMLNADAVIVHHGLFWKNENPVIKGIKYNRIKTILNNSINLYCWHLPLDIHYEFGNNVQLAKLLSIEICGKIHPFVFWGEFKHFISYNELIFNINKIFLRRPYHCSSKSNLSNLIKKIAWCSGAGQNYIDYAINFGVDAFITGEISEQTFHIIRENNIHFFSIGHYVSERYGIISLGMWLKDKYNLKITFFDVDNPI